MFAINKDMRYSSEMHSFTHFTVIFEKLLASSTFSAPFDCIRIYIQLLSTLKISLSLFIEVVNDEMIKIFNYIATTFDSGAGDR